MNSMPARLGSVGRLRRRPESEQFFSLAKTAKQAMFVLSSMQPDAARWKKGRSKPDRVFRQSLTAVLFLLLGIGGILLIRLSDKTGAQARESEPTGDAAMVIANKHTNRLGKETSPYLLQHAHNPVDWYAWSEEAFARARAEDKPIFLSIGYSTCHWCHVMEHESFEDEAIAALMNEHFICI